jgi:prepilin-type N-terminal cleavage/methylation domain-containing protein
MTRRRQQRRSFGFTLIEMLVALVMGVIVMSVSMGILARTSVNASRDAVRASLVREANLIHAMLQHDHRYAGVGVPRRGSLSNAAELFDGSILVASANELGLLGDFPRPHAPYNTFGALWNEPGGDNQTFTWVTENSGACIPPQCTTGDYSVFFPGTGESCDAAADFNNRTCPWGLKRLENNDRYLIASGNGEWTRGQFTFAATEMVQNGTNNTWFPSLATGWVDPGPSWPNVLPTDAPAGVAGMGWVTSLDRVFWDYDSGTTTLRRRQCWGDPDPLHTNWPRDTGTAIPANPDTLTGGLFAQCSAWEVISDRVVSAAFTYFDASSVTTPIAGAINTSALKQSVRMVKYDLVLEETHRGVPVQFPVRGAAPIRNRL